MSPKPRYVFDTSAIVSALLFEHSVPARAFAFALERGEILLSESTAAELKEVLGRRKFDRYLSREKRDQFLVRFIAAAMVIEVVDEVHVCRDSKDNKFLDLALSGRASSLITGDQDLLALHPFREIPILTPASFLELLAKEVPEEPNQPT